MHHIHDKPSAARPTEANGKEVLEGLFSARGREHRVIFEAEIEGQKEFQMREGLTVRLSPFNFPDVTVGRSGRPGIGDPRVVRLKPGEPTKIHGWLEFTWKNGGWQPTGNDVDIVL